MGNPAGVKRDFDALERRRFKAFALLSKGVSEAEIARQVGAHRQSVNRWAKAIEEQGREGLRQAGRAGRKSRLSEAELKRLEERLKRGAEVAGYETKLWSAMSQPLSNGKSGAGRSLKKSPARGAHDSVY